MVNFKHRWDEKVGLFLLTPEGKGQRAKGILRIVSGKNTCTHFQTVFPL